MQTIATRKLSIAAYDRLRDKVEKLNKRAVRLGLDKLDMTVGPAEPVVQVGPSGLKYTVMMTEVTVSGCAPCINGWSVIARIEFTDAGNLVHCAPGVDNIDPKYRTVDATCEHCNTCRRRNDVIVIRDEAGNDKRVGRNCLADFIRTDNAEGLLAYASYTLELVCSDFEDGTSCRMKPVETPLTVAAAASVCIRKLGWKSSSAGYDTGNSSTKMDVIDLLFPPAGSNAHKEWELWIKRNDLFVTDFDTDRAGRAIEWAKGLQSAESEYLNNLRVLAQLDYIGLDKFGYAVSIICAYEKACEREIERKEREGRIAAKGEKVFIGSPKVRMKAIKATCVGINSFDGNYGVTTLVRFEQRISDTAYAVLVWFASGDKTEDFEVGNEYTFDATVKDHNDHNDYGRQTLLTRVSVK